MRDERSAVVTMTCFLSGSVHCNSLIAMLPIVVIQKKNNGSQNDTNFNNGMNTINSIATRL